MVKRITLVLSILVAMVGCNQEKETFLCELQDLDNYGFVNFSEYDEYVCVNEDDYADFIIVADEASNLSLGDKLSVELNEHGEVVRYSTLQK